MQQSLILSSAFGTPDLGLGLVNFGEHVPKGRRGGMETWVVALVSLGTLSVRVSGVDQVVADEQHRLDRPVRADRDPLRSGQGVAGRLLGEAEVEQQPGDVAKAFTHLVPPLLNAVYQAIARDLRGHVHIRYLTWRCQLRSRTSSMGPGSPRSSWGGSA